MGTTSELPWYASARLRLVGHPMALRTYARLVTRHGRAGEAFTMLVPHADDWALATALVEVAAIAGRG